tara:strand:- start:797 stop:3157 length:2361 start_codon:yes stop_codon:yes gene_type:complete
MIETEALTDVSVAAKERLAKLLATEDITIEHRADVQTAMFDVKGRTLILPQWKAMSKDLYDLLVLHEVGHALFTPLDGWHGAVSEKGSNYKGFLNVTEDARIEKRVKRKYPGGRRSFIAGYKDLMARDFFGTKDRDLATFGLIDRLNLHAKGGALAGVPFSDDEMVWVERLESLETFAEAKALADDLWDYARDQVPETDVNTGQGEQGEPEDSDDDGEGESVPVSSDEGDASDSDDTTPDSSDDSDEDGESADGSSSDDTDDTDADSTDGAGDNEGEASDSADGDDADGDDGESSTTGAGGDVAGSNASGTANEAANEPKAETDDSFREMETSLVDDDPYRSEIVYATVPEDSAYDLDALIIPVDDVIKDVREFQAETLERFSQQGYRVESLGTWDSALAGGRKLRKDNAKTVAYLAKEFELRKAADANKRASTSKTGVLDTAKLHSYKWNEDVFKKVTRIADGKNHGLQMFVDWSGSMSPNMSGTIDQVINLVLFCKKVGIPFDVYAFSDSTSRYVNGEIERPGSVLDKDALRDSDLDFRRNHFRLIQLATSKGKANSFNDQLAMLFILRNAMGYGCATDGLSYSVPRHYNLGGTPLAEAMLSAIPVTTRFREENGLQIVNVVFLTDGEGYDLQTVGGHYARGKNVIFRDSITRREYTGEQSASILNILRNRTGANVVNFYISDYRANGFKRDYSRASGDYAGEAEAWKTAKAEGGVVIADTNAGWDELYLMTGGDTLETRQDEGLGDQMVGAKKAQLRRAFGKAATGKLRCRTILRRFTEMVAA